MPLVRIQVSRVDLDGRKIDFRLVRDNEELLMRPAKDTLKSSTKDSKTGAKKSFNKIDVKNNKSGIKKTGVPKSKSRRPR
jgi:ribonuclease R